MIEVLRFWVPGNPKTKGSLEVVNSGRLKGRPVLRDSKASGLWRQLVAYQARQEIAKAGAAYDGPSRFPLVGQVSTYCYYFLPATPLELIRQGSGDVDKLDRNIFDALQDAGVYANDAQIVRSFSEKFSMDDVSPAELVRRGPGVDVVVQAPLVP